MVVVDFDGYEIARHVREEDCRVKVLGPPPLVELLATSSEGLQPPANAHRFQR
jgi:hypothetical protein